MPVKRALEVLGEPVDLLVHRDGGQLFAAGLASLTAELSAERQLRVVVEMRAADEQYTAPLERLPAGGDDGVVEQIIGVGDADEFCAELRTQRLGFSHQLNIQNRIFTSQEGVRSRLWTGNRSGSRSRRPMLQE